VGLWLMGLWLDYGLVAYLIAWLERITALMLLNLMAWLVIGLVCYLIGIN